MTHICVSELTIIGSDNGLSPGRCQAIIWNNAGSLLIEPLGTNFNEISIGIPTFLFKKMHLNMSSAKWRPFCLGLSVLNDDVLPPNLSCRIPWPLPTCHAVYSPAEKVLWVFVSGKLLDGSPPPPPPPPPPLKLSVVSLTCDVIIIMYVRSQHAIEGSLAEPLRKVNPFPQQSKISHTDSAVDGYEYNASHSNL